MRVAVLYIGLGSYSVMWKDFYLSAKRFFLVNHEVHFFLFTDDQTIPADQALTIIKTANMGWPGNTLYRFALFTSIGDALREFDYVFFFNANALFLKKIDDSILPTSQEKLVSVQHFAYAGKHPAFIGYDRNKRSLAYVPWGHEPPHYCQACLLGGESRAFLDMCSELAANIDFDTKYNVCARWHDESHFNHYLMTHPVKVLPIKYAFPESIKKGDSEICILMRDKTKIADLNVLRYGSKKSVCQTLVFKAKNTCVKIRSLFHRAIWSFHR